MESPRPAGGAAEALRGLGATLLDMVGTRVELALVELREYGERRKRIVALAFVAVLFLGLGLLFAGGIVVAIVALVRLRTLAHESTPPFQETLAALHADRELLRPDA